MISFGTGGWRAIIGDGFTKYNVQRLSVAIARRMKDEGCVERGFVIGYDRRFLSREAAEWAAEILAAEGIPTKVIKREAPTPLIMFTVQMMNMSYGMAVTASHNPALYNGIKLFTYGGRDAVETITNELSAVANTITADDLHPITYAEGLASGMIEEINPKSTYINSITNLIDIEAIRRSNQNNNLRIVLDPMFGVSRTSLQSILLTAHCDVDVIHERRDALFGGRLPAPTEETLSELRMTVLESDADIGIATDGDADRLGIIDDTGRFIHPNEILCLLYDYLLRVKGWKGCCVRNLATTHLLDRIAAANGEICHEVPVGFKHISWAMEQNDALIGGESSGGLTVRGHIRGKDGIYAAALLVEMLAVTGKKLSTLIEELYERYGHSEMVEYDWPFDQAMKDRLIQLLMVDRKLPDFPETVVSTSYMDGMKARTEDGWIIARFSGTEPRLRIFCEMPTVARAIAMVATMADFCGLKMKK